MVPAAVSYLVDLWVVDDLIGDVHLLVREGIARLICHAHCPLHAPAVAIGLCQLHCDLPLLPGVVLLPHLSHQAAGGVAHAMLLHQSLALLVVLRLAHVPTRLVQGPPHVPAVHLFGVCCRPAMSRASESCIPATTTELIAALLPATCAAAIITHCLREPAATSLTRRGRCVRPCTAQGACAPKLCCSIMVLAQQLVTEQGRPGSWKLARHGAGTSWPDERDKGLGCPGGTPGCEWPSESFVWSRPSQKHRARLCCTNYRSGTSVVTAAYVLQLRSASLAFLCQQRSAVVCPIALHCY